MNDRCPVCQSPVGAQESACGVCGFKLVGKTSRFEPVPSQSIEVEACPRSGTAALRPIRGPQVGVVYPLDAPEVSIGRDPGCGVFLNDMTVSRVHAQIRHEGGCCVIRDKGSYNGVWVNNKSVDEKVLQDGDIVQIGSFAFIYEG